MQFRWALLVVSGVWLLAGANPGQAEEASGKTMLSRLPVGRFIMLEQARSGGFNLVLLTDSSRERLEKLKPGYVPPKIIEVAADHVVIDDQGLKQFLAAHAIDLITEQADAEEAAVNEVEKDARAEPVFRPATDEERAAGGPGLVIGPYLLEAEAVEKLNKVHTLELTLNELKHLGGEPKRWDKQNADLTVRQRMSHYLQSAYDFYVGRGVRQPGVTGKRQQKYTEAELGDQQLSSALMTVGMAATWDVPLEAGQAEQLDRVLRRRLKMIDR